jgi:hypothetical protein
VLDVYGLLLGREEQGRRPARGTQSGPSVAISFLSFVSLLKTLTIMGFAFFS